ncbi:MAG TPA: type II toxin-antitoxin system Phd/YefM family antitoxin [Acidobacteriota bacterium]|jgi:prevent-host-death family protein
MKPVKISKSKFKPRALEYFRQVETTGTEVIITDRGRPVAKIVPYSESARDILKELRHSVIEYDHPTKPVALEDWESLK